MGNRKTTNWRHLSTPIKRQRVTRRRKEVSRRQSKIRSLEVQISHLVENNKSLLEDPDIHNDLVGIMDEYDEDMNKLSQDDVKRILWNQQVHAYMHAIFHNIT